MSIGDVTMFATLAGSVLALDPNGQRSAVLLFLVVSFAPFVVLAPLIGPTIDRMPGGRRTVIQVTAVVRAGLYVMMAFHTDDVVLYPLLFVALVMQKTYAVSRIAIVPLVVRDNAELVEANSSFAGLIWAWPRGAGLRAVGGRQQAQPGPGFGDRGHGVRGGHGGHGQAAREAVAAEPVAVAERHGAALGPHRARRRRGGAHPCLDRLPLLPPDVLDEGGLRAGPGGCARRALGSMAGNVAAPHLRRVAHEERG